MTTLQHHNLTLGIPIWYLNPPRPDTTPTSHIHLQMDPVQLDGTSRRVPLTKPTLENKPDMTQEITPLFPTPST